MKCLRTILWHSVVGVRLDVGCLGVRAASYGDLEDTDPEPLAVSVCAIIVPAAPGSGVFGRKCGEVQSWFLSKEETLFFDRQCLWRCWAPQ